MKFIRPVLSTLGGMNSRIRDVARFREVSVIFVRYGFGALVSGISGSGIENDASFVSNPKRALKAIQELGPTFIKFGQILSTRPDIMPQEYIDEFQALQDHAKVLSFSQVEKVLIDEFGADWKSFVLSFDEQPLASASIAQVHRAVLKDNTPVVLKIQRPKIATLIRSDLNILLFILERALVEYPELRLFDPIGMFQEFRRSLLQELDFSAEFKHLERFAKNFDGVSIVRVPKAYAELSSNRVLCMDFFEAVGIRYAREKGYDMERVGENYLEVAYSMLFRHGFFHGDLHPGNILVFEDCTLGLLDCGMVGFLSEEMKDTLAGLIYSLYRGDHRMVAKLFYDLSIKEERVDFGRFEQDAMEVAELHWTGESFQDMDIGAFLMDISFRAMRHKVRAPPSYTMFFKGVMTTEGLAKALLPEVDPLRAAQPFVEELVRNRWQPAKLTEMGTYNLLSYANLMRRLPISFGQLLDDFDQQRFRIHVEQRTNLKDQLFRNRIQFWTLVLWVSSLWILLGLALFFIPESFLYGKPILSMVLIALSILMQVMALFRTFFHKLK